MKDDLTFNRMREIERWKRYLSLYFLFSILAFLLLVLVVANVTMWWIGQLGTEAYPEGGPAAEQDFLYSSWYIPMAVFTGIVSMLTSVVLISELARKHPRAKWWFGQRLSPMVAFLDYFKLAVVTGIGLSVCFALTFFAAKHLPVKLKFLLPPDQTVSKNEWENVLEILSTRGVQFALFGVLALYLAQTVSSKYAFLPKSESPEGKVRRFWFIAAYLVVFEALYILLRVPMKQLFWPNFEQAYASLLTAGTWVFFYIVSAALFSGFLAFLSLRLPQARFPVECKVVLSGISRSGKTRFFGESLLNLRKKRFTGFSLDLFPETREFVEKFRERRLFWLLTGTIKPDRYSFEITDQRRNALLRFHWQDVPGGATTSLNHQYRSEWRHSLNQAHAVCFFLEARELLKGLERVQDFEEFQETAKTYISEMLQTSSFERPPIICVVVTKIDTVTGAEEKKAVAEAKRFEQLCKEEIQTAKLPRSFTRTFVTSAMMNARGLVMPPDVTESTLIGVDPEPRNCAEVLLWVSARIFESKSLGLEGVKAAVLGRSTPLGELQLKMDEYVGEAS